MARLLLAVGVTLLLALGVVSLNSARGSTIHSSGTLEHLWLLFAFLAFVGAATMAYQLLLRREGADRASEAATRFNRAALVVFALLALALPAAFYLARPSASGNSNFECPDCRMPTQAAPGGTKPVNIVGVTSDHSPHSLNLHALLVFLSITGIVVLAIAAVIVIIVVMRMRRPAPDPIHGLALPAHEIVDDTELERAVLAGRNALEGEARAAIIACYAAMEESLVAAGVTRLSSDSPADLLARAAAGGMIAGRAPGTLAALFREARFSKHEMNGRQLGDARAALDEILAQLAERQRAAASRAAEEAARTAAQAAKNAQADAAAAASNRGGRTGRRG